MTKGWLRRDVCVCGFGRPARGRVGRCPKCGEWLGRYDTKAIAVWEGGVGGLYELWDESAEGALVRVGVWVSEWRHA